MRITSHLCHLHFHLPLIIVILFFQIHYDGWPDEYDLWVEDSYTGVHPPTWCFRTKHPLMPPLSEWCYKWPDYVQGDPSVGEPGIGLAKILGDPPAGGSYCSYLLPKQDGETSQIKVNPSQVRHQMGHPVQCSGKILCSMAHSHTFHTRWKLIITMLETDQSDARTKGE